MKNLFVRLPWATHGCELSYGGPCGQIMHYAVERFLDSVMTGPAPVKPATRQAKAAARTTSN